MDEVTPARLISQRKLSEAEAGGHAQELRAGTAPITDFCVLAGERPHPAGVQIALVPVLFTPRAAWRNTCVGDPLSALTRKVSRMGGIEVGKQSDPLVRWNTFFSDEKYESWIRVDVSLTGPWTGKFSLSAPAGPLSDVLWTLTCSTILAFCAEEDASLITPTPGEELPDWDTFLSRLNRIPSVSVNPSSAIGKLIENHGWPTAADRGFDNLIPVEP